MIATAWFNPKTDAEANDAVARFVAQEIWPGKADAGFGPHASLAVIEDGVMIGGVVYHNWYPDTGVVEMSAAAVSPRWLARPVIKAMFDLPFKAMGCQMTVLRVSENNRRMVKIARSFGFGETYIPRMRGRGEGEFVFHYTDDAWAASRFNA